MIIRQALSTDIPAIQLVRNSVKENTLSDPALVPDSDVEDYINNRGRGWVAVNNGIIIGFSIVSITDRNVWALFVLPEYEARGAGRQLHDVMIDWYFAQTGDKLWLSTTPGTRAENFYRKAGWREAGTYGKNELKFEMDFEQWEI
jgi:GNAT superfamily N-acetyltransferase